MTPAQTLDAARSLLEVAGASTQGVWSRAAALLARQALEGMVRDRLSRRFPGADSAPMRAQLLCLSEVVEPSLAQRVAWTWSTLSEACHHHGYGLPPTAGELRTWMDVVDELDQAAKRAG